MALVARATAGAFSVERSSDRRYALTEPGRPVAMVNRRSDAELFARDRLDLRALVSGVAEVLSRHTTTAGGSTRRTGS